MIITIIIGHSIAIVLSDHRQGQKWRELIQYGGQLLQDRRRNTAAIVCKVTAGRHLIDYSANLKLRAFSFAFKGILFLNKDAFSNNLKIKVIQHTNQTFQE